MNHEKSSLFSLRQTAFDRGACDNGPDEYGNWPCDPKVLLGCREAECQVCGRVAAWGEDARACDALDEAIYEQTGRHPADG